MPDSSQPFEVIEAPARIGLVADTHRRSGSSLDLPGEMMSRLNGCDAIFHLGDFNSVAVLDELCGVAPVYGVYGNNDEREIAERLPERRFLMVGSRRLGLIHGHQAGRNARGAAVVAMRGKVDCAIYGHSHLPDYSQEEGLLLINPGSPTQRRRAPHRSFAIMSIDEQSEIDVEFVNVT